MNHADGLFCRTSDKTLFPICGNDVVDNCFSLAIEQLIIRGKAARNNRYAHVAEWGGIVG